MRISISYHTSTCLLLQLLLISCSRAFVPTSTRISSSTTSLFAKETRTTQKQTTVLGDEEKPAGIVGAQFFGGNKQKEEYFDPVAEEQASSLAEVDSSTTFSRFAAAANSFDEGLSAELAMSLQTQVNAALYERAPEPNTEYTYASSVRWETPFKQSQSSASNPLEELANALAFYKNVDVAIVGGRQTSENSVQLEWEISVVWPTFWAPRILLIGTSEVRLGEGKTIVAQTDSLLDGADLLGTVGPQIAPRFWDWYHIGMAPTAELMPKLALEKPSFFRKYQVYEIPSRVMLKPTMIDVGERDDRNAQFIPSQAFSCAIKTMGPKRQLYVPTSPVEVQLIPGGENLKLQWSMPLAVEFQTNLEYPIAGEDPEALKGSCPETSYERQPRRKVATVPYGGDPQDTEISEIRKSLYDDVVKNGLKPKLDDAGRPIFFFVQNTVKGCYTEEGLGMCVYEWRPKRSEANEVGIELEFS